MTVKEFIERLKDFTPESEIKFFGVSGVEWNINSLDEYPIKDSDKGKVKLILK